MDKTISKRETVPGNETRMKLLCPEFSSDLEFLKEHYLIWNENELKSQIGNFIAKWQRKLSIGPHGIFPSEKRISPINSTFLPGNPFKTETRNPFLDGLEKNKTSRSTAISTSTTKTTVAASTKAAAAAATTTKTTKLDPDHLRSLKLSELLQTERKYVKDLEIYIEVFVHPLKEAANTSHIVSKKEVELIFGNIEEVFAANKQLLFELEQQFKDHPIMEVDFSSPFIRMGPILSEIYSKYAANCRFSEIQLSILEQKRISFSRQHHWSSHPIKDSFLEAMDAANKDARLERRTLDSFLLTPIQRVPRYELLLRDLLPTSSDQELPLVRKVLQQIAIRMNQSKTMSENIEKVLHIQSRIQGEFPNLAIPTRAFVREGTLYKVSSRVPKPVHIFLFSDLLLYTTPVHYRYKSSLRLESATVQDLPDNDQWRYAFQISIASKVLVLCASNLDGKHSWMYSLNEVIERLREKTKEIGKQLEEFSSFSLYSREEQSAKVNPTRNNSVLKEGYLYKQGGILKQWRRRWFVLKGNTLYRFPTEPKDASVIPKAIYLREYSCSELNASNIGRPYCIHLYHHDLPCWIISANNVQEFEEWFQSLKNAIPSEPEAKTSPIPNLKQQRQNGNEKIETNDLISFGEEQTSSQESIGSLIELS